MQNLRHSVETQLALVKYLCYNLKMTKIRIPIELVRDTKTRPVRLPVLYVAPMIAISLFLGFMFGSGVLLPSANPREQVGAVLESMTDSSTPELASVGAVVVDTTVPAADTLALDTPEDNVLTQNDIDVAPSPTPEPESLLNAIELDLAITDREDAMTKLNEEIARLKNDSVALVSLFNTNCGNWKDECAVPYAATLEVNNSTYNDLVQKVIALQRELNQFNAEKILRQ